jgi:hypothetical protein
MNIHFVVTENVETEGNLAAIIESEEGFFG